MDQNQLNLYLEKQAAPEPPLLAELNRETHVKMLYARMLSGHFQGRLLSMLSKLIQPNRILEIGTFTGYSALCLAEGLSENGLIFTIEANPEVLLLARSYFERSDFSAKIISLEGDAAILLDTINETFDLVFIDADKKSNEKYVYQVLDKIRPGGLILIDNVLWNGKIAAGETDPDTLIIRDMNERLSKHPNLESIILPIRDGIMLLRKKENGKAF